MEKRRARQGGRRAASFPETERVQNERALREENVTVMSEIILINLQRITSSAQPTKLGRGAR